MFVQGALDRGMLHMSDVKLWLQLMGTPILGQLCKLAPAFRDRMLGNPRFLMVLAIEEAIGVAAKWSAEVNSRGDRFKKVVKSLLDSLPKQPRSRSTHHLSELALWQP